MDTLTKALARDAAMRRRVERFIRKTGATTPASSPARTDAALMELRRYWR